MKTKAQTNKPQSKTPRPACGDCLAWQRPCGCGYLDAGLPCAHPTEKRRFQQEQTHERKP